MLVFGKIHSGPRPDLRHYVLQNLPVGRGRLFERLGDLDAGLRGGEAQHVPGHIPDRQHKVDLTGCDRVLGHGIELGFLRVLRDREPALLLDLPEAEAAVRASPRQNDPNAAVAVRVGQGLEEMIDRRTPLVAFLDFREAQVAVDRREIAARRNHIDMVRLDLLIFGHLSDRHRGKRLQHLGHDELGFLRVLRDREPALLLDLPEAEAAVRAST